MTKKIIKVGSLEDKGDLRAEVKSAGRGASRVLMGSTGVVTKSALAAKGEAERIIQDAENEAVRIRREAEAILNRVSLAREDAKKSGRIEGEEEGFGAATELLVKFQAMKEEFYKTSEDGMIKLVMKISEQVIGQLVHDHEAVIQSIVRQAIDASLGDRIVVRLNPEDLQHVQKENFGDMLDRTRRLIFKGDDTISRGGCMVETEVGTIDARLETQLKAIKKALEL